MWLCTMVFFPTHRLIPRSANRAPFFKKSAAHYASVELRDRCAASLDVLPVLRRQTRFLHFFHEVLAGDCRVAVFTQNQTVVVEWPNQYHSQAHQIKRFLIVDRIAGLLCVATP